MRSLRWRVAAPFVVLGALLLPAVAAAGGGTIEDAKQWVAEGDKLADAGDCKSAVVKYRQALGVKETAQIYLRIGACQETAGELADALQTYRAAKVIANDKTAPVVEEKISALKPRVPGLTFVLPAPRPADMRVEVNGVAVSDFAAEAFVNPGEVVIDATATGMQPVHQRLTLAPGEHQRFEVRFGAAVAPPVDTPPPDGPPGPKPSIPGIVLASAGVVGLGLGIGFVVHGFGVEQDLIDGCGEADPDFICTDPGDTIGPDEAQGYVDESNAFKGGGFAALGIGAAAATVGGVLLGLSLRSKPTAAPPVAVLPIVTGRFAGVTALGTF